MVLNRYYLYHICSPRNKRQSCQYNRRPANCSPKSTILAARHQLAATERGSWWHTNLAQNPLFRYRPFRYRPHLLLKRQYKREILKDSPKKPTPGKIFIRLASENHINISTYRIIYTLLMSVMYILTLF